MTSEEFDALNDEMVRRLFGIIPDAGTRFGMHDPYDGMLPHGGFRRLQDTADLLASWLSRAEKIAGSEELDPDQEISIEVLRMSEALQRFAIDDYRQWEMYPEATEVPGTSLLLMMIRHYGEPEEKASRMASRIGELPRYLEEFRDRFRPGRAVKHWTAMSVDSAKGFPEFLDVIEKHWKGKVPEGISSELAKNVSRAKEELEDHLEWLKNLQGSARPEFAMGRERLEKLLRIRGFGLTVDQALSFGERSLRELKAERDRVAARMAPGKGPEAALEIMHADCPATFDEALAKTSRELENAKRFIREKGIATVDYDATLHVLETPSFMASMISTAALEMAAPFEEHQQGILMLTRVSGEELRNLYCRTSILNMAVHEAYPGHFHQGVVSNKKPWMHQLSLMLIEPDTMVPSWETQEGWGMYCEKMMIDRGFMSTLADQYAMLDFAIWRACRIIYDVGFATGDSSLEDMIQMFMRETNSSRDTTEAELFGFSRTPGYALSYLTGRQMVFDLKADLVRELGGAFNEKRFHDLMAENGNLPFHLAQKAVRAGM